MMIINYSRTPSTVDSQEQRVATVRRKYNMITCGI